MGICCDIERGSSVPVYLQIKKRIEDYLESGNANAGDRLPTDTELCEMFHVSLMTARKAITILAAEGRIVRIRSKGTFVAERAVETEKRDPKLIGVIMPQLVGRLDSFDSPSHYETAQGIESVFAEQGYNLTLMTSRHAPLSPDTLCEMPFAGMIIVFPVEKDSILIDAVESRKMPFVAMNCFLQNREINRVNVDSFSGGYVTTRHLIESGRRRIAFLGREVFRGGGAAHHHGYVAAMNDSGFDPILRTVPVGCEKESDGGRYEWILDGIDGIVAADDWIAAWVLRLAGKQNVKVPEDLAVAGYFDEPICEKTVPMLTSVHVPSCLDMGQKAAGLLLEMINNPSRCSETVNLPVELIVRESTGKRAIRS